MAESIEYSSIVKFINDDIIQEKLARVARQAGGTVQTSNSNQKSSTSQAGDLSTTTTGAPSTTPIDFDQAKKQVADNKAAEQNSSSELLRKVNDTKNTLGFGFTAFFDTISSEITNILGENFPRMNQTSISVLVNAIGVSAYLYFTNDADVAKTLMIGVVCFICMNYGKTALQNMIKYFKGKEGETMAGGSFGSSSYTKILIALFVSVAAGLLATELSGVTDFSARFYQWASGASKGPVSFYFDESKGNIVVTGKLNTSVEINSSSHFGVKGIKMGVKGDVVTYTVNDIPLESYSYIEGRPVHTALVMAYLVKDKHYNRFAPSSSAVKRDSDFVYSIEDDGSVRLFKKGPNGERGEELASMNMAIRKQLEGDEDAATKAKTAVCQDLFQVGVNDKTCAAHFYNILGKSALGMLKNMGAAASTDKVVDALLSAQPHIKYEILKNLDWKMKISNGKKEMVNADQWLERLEQDGRPGIKALAAEYKTYFSGNDKIKQILNKMVMDVNNNSRLLEEKYKEAVEQPQPPMRKRRPRLTSSQVASLRSQVLTENVALNTPFPMPGVPGAYLYNYTNPFQTGGADDNAYSRNFSNLKQSLAGFNQKLSSETERKINSKISEIKSLNDRLEDISRKIHEYTKILRSEKYPTGVSRTITLSDVDNLINQYKSGTQQQTKEIVTLSTAFGKIKMLLEKQDASARPAEKSFMFDL